MAEGDAFATSAFVTSAFGGMRKKISSGGNWRYHECRILDWEKTYHLFVDTLAFAIGVVLNQKDENKKYYPIYFASKQLSAAEKNYTTTEQEALEIVFLVKKF
ncbi:hypothetical protein AXG93_3088s1010 [Marchantia polymorpha subsp. ruderalis]|uniref:Reverse transcriptase/retrotransposon-derived protein RNase H-like domain-containing protein n=1 Tax=Marchantia polymorpha subsp. ruderalis TaxID=1480154 RepID=A0A176VMJ7_MARPO|nr:hypothetical protein AXG93_3088s1010 [Marchantia polymorpha subsp. ruderalis]